MLDEKALRKPEFEQGPKICLGDGQLWTFPKPRLRLYPVVDDEGEVRVGGGRSFGEEYDLLAEALIEGSELPPEERIQLKFSAAVRLLRSNYNLTPSDIRKLLVMDAERPETTSYWQKLTNLILGYEVEESEEDADSPKTSADGSVTP